MEFNNDEKKKSIGIVISTPKNPLKARRKNSYELIPLSDSKSRIDKLVLDEKMKFIQSISSSQSINEKEQKSLEPLVSITEPQQLLRLHPISLNLLPILDPSLDFIKSQHKVQNKAFEHFSFNSPSKIKSNKKVSLDQTNTPHLRSIKPRNPVTTTERHLSLPSLKKIQIPCFPMGFYDCDQSANKYKFKRSPQITISKEVSPQKKINTKQQETPIKNKSKNKKQAQNKKKDSLGLLKHLREIKLEQDPQIQKLRRHSKLSVKVIQDFDNNFQQKIKDAMMKALKLKQNVYKT